MFNLRIISLIFVLRSEMFIGVFMHCRRDGSIGLCISSSILYCNVQGSLKLSYLGGRHRVRGVISALIWPCLSCPTPQGKGTSQLSVEHFSSELAQQNWLGFLGLTGIFKTWIFKTFQSSRHLLCSFAFPMLRDKWCFRGGLVEKLQQRFFYCTAPVVRCLESSSSYGISRLLPEAQLTWCLFSVWFEKCHLFQLSLVHVFLNLEYS